MSESQQDFHNVVIFGAGASADAGIPLLPSFVEKMWEYAMRGKVGDEKLGLPDLEILTKANQIRIILENYNSRASFNSRDLEDLLSLLSFEALAGDGSSQDYDAMVRAVARTIELSCAVKAAHCKEPWAADNFTVYHHFWRALLSDKFRGNLPGLITFNYDLVFERTLFQMYHRVDVNLGRMASSCRLKYDFGSNYYGIKSAFVAEGIPARNVRRAAYLREDEISEAEIPYYKLHGSLNWDLMNPEAAPGSPIEAVDTPCILPPVFNKMNKREVNKIWNKALGLLRHAKHIIIVGYSLPRTDIYMQYFLKSAVGPNSNLNKVIVFNPMLFEDTQEASDMRNRYLYCFSQPFHNRILFRPPVRRGQIPEGDAGTFNHFLSTLHNNPEFIFYQP